MSLFEIVFFSMLIGIGAALKYGIRMPVVLLILVLTIGLSVLLTTYKKWDTNEKGFNKKCIGLLFVLLVSMIVALVSGKYAEYYSNNRMSQLSKIAKEEYILLYLTQPMQEKTRNSFQGSSQYYSGIFKTEDCEHNFKVSLNLPESLNLGQQIAVDPQKLEIPEPSAGAGQIDFRGYNFSKHILLQGNLAQNEYLRVEQVKKPLAIRIEQHKQCFYRKLDSYFGEQAGLLKGMVFGDTENITDEDLALLTSLGLRHLFAVSGFHVGIYYCLLLMLCALIGCKGWPRTIVITTGLVYFCLLTGYSASTLRASLVLFIYLAMENLEWEKRFATSLAMAGMVLLVWNPYLIYSVGYKLSFAAAFGIQYLYPFFKKMFGMRILGVGLSAWLGSLPFQSVFYGVSWIGIIFTPVFSLFLSLFLPCVFCAYILDFCFLANVILIGLKPVLKLLGFLLHVFEHVDILSWFLENTILCFPLTSLPRMVFYYACLAILLWLGTQMLEKYTRKKQILTSCIILLLVLFLSLPVPARGLEIVFINVGQGDASLIRYRNFSMLVDTGTRQAGQYAVVPFLRSKKLEHINLLVLTHPDQDHIGGALRLLDSVEVDYVAFSFASKNELMLDETELLEKLEEKRIPYGYHASGDRWRIKELLIQTISPNRKSCQKELGSNEGSLVLAVRFENMYIQMTGDMEGTMLENLLEPIQDENIFLMKAPHHGSRGSFDETIFNQLDVDLVVVSCGKNNRYGHPHKEVIEYWQQRAVPVYRTDEQGELFFRYVDNALFLEN